MLPLQLLPLAQASTLLSVTLGTLMFLAAVFLILLILVQRGRGGGLTGALGGMGGQSAFGAKAGDTFTKITIWASAIWILLCMTAVVALNRRETVPNKNPGAQATGSTSPTTGTSTPGATGNEKPAGDAGATGTGTSGSGTTGGSGAAGTGSNTNSGSGSTTENPASGGTGD
jgi:preprotein translocase subunit SecG